jgi:hypothetical protein
MVGHIDSKKMIMESWVSSIITTEPIILGVTCCKVYISDCALRRTECSNMSSVCQTHTASQSYVDQRRESGRTTEANKQGPNVDEC